MIDLLPTKSKILRTVRKVFPDARFERMGTAVGLRYRPPGQREEVEIAHVEIGTGNERGAQLALMMAAFQFYGFKTQWHPKVNKFTFEAIEGYKGPEDMLPMEFDPNTPDEEAEQLIERAGKETIQ